MTGGGRSHGTRIARARLGRLAGAAALAVLVVLGVALAGTAASSPVPLLAGGSGAAASLGLDATVGPVATGPTHALAAAAIVAPVRERRPLAVRRHGGEAPHWRTGLLGVLLSAVTAVATQPLGAAVRHRGDAPRPGRGRRAGARAPPALLPA